MPYIKQELRDEIDECLDVLSTKIKEMAPDGNVDGIVNYAITTLVAKTFVPPSGCWKYSILNRAYGTFHSAAAEFYRRLVAPYENDAITKNSDICVYK